MSVTKKRNLNLLYGFGFILALASALPAYIQTSFLSEFLNEKYLGLFFIVSNVILLFVINYYAHFIKKYTNYQMAVFIIVLYVIAIVCLVLAQSIWMIFVFFSLFLISSTLIWINMDIFLESCTNNKTTGRIRTRYFTCMNLAWLIMPLVVGYLVRGDNYRFVFIVTIFVLLIFIVFLTLNKNKLQDHTVYQHTHTTAVLKKIWRSKDLRNIYIIAFLLQFFYAFAVMYVPLYLHNHLGMPWTTIGWIFTFMLLPFIFLEIPAGYLADKYIGEKELLVVGFLVLSLATFSIFFVNSASVLLWAVILFSTRVGAAIIEAMRETYFFKKVDKEDIDYINLFRDTGPLAYIIGPLLAIIILQLFPFNYLFLFLGIIVLSGLWFVFNLTDTK